MDYIQLLTCSGELGNCCNDTSIALLLDSFRRIMGLIQIIVPIILLIFASIEFFKLVINPEKKGGNNRLRNMFIGTVVVFFVPVVVDAVLSILPQSYSLSACWDQSKSTVESSSQLKLEYRAPYTTKDKQTIFTNPSEYEPGVPRPKTNTSGNNTGNSSGNHTDALAPASAKGVLEGAEKVHTMYEQNGWAYYSDFGELRWGDINYSTNNPSKKTCCATFVGSAFLIGGVFSEAEINEFNYNSQYGISELCEAKGWTRINDYGQLAAGDVVIMSGPGGGTEPGHVQIYAGNGTWYNAGSTNIIQAENPYSDDASGRFLYAWRRPA